MNGHIVFIDGRFFIQEANGNLTPIALGGGGGSRGLSSSSVINLINQYGGNTLIDVNTGFSQSLTFSDSPNPLGQEVGGVANTGNFVQTIPANTMKVRDVYRVTINVPMNLDNEVSGLRFGFYRNFQTLGSNGVIVEPSSQVQRAGGTNTMPPQSGILDFYGGGYRAIVEMQVVSIVNNLASVISSMMLFYSNPFNDGQISYTTMSNVPAQPIDVTINQKFSFVGVRSGGLDGGTAQATLMMIELLRKK